MNAAGIVLCGGRSQRMGRSKAWLPWRGRPMLEHVVDRLREAVGEVVVVGPPQGSLPEVRARVVRDEEPHLGPLAGIREGLRAIEAERAFVVSTDAPYLTAEFVRAMFGFGAAAAPVVDGYVQTLTAVYPKAAVPAIDGLIAAGRMRPLFALEASDYVAVPQDQVDARAVRGFNTPAEYLDAVRAEDGDATATVELLGRARLAIGVPALSVPVGTLAEVLRQVPKIDLLDGDRVAALFLVSLNGGSFVRDGAVPIGPGDAVIVMDASVGG